ncbi:papain family cysteine protease domain-containing protein [Phthorimaea operculella]|nr:papain family cysteine protease domain-containing protein [Phthorimaea operculella]
MMLALSSLLLLAVAGLSEGKTLSAPEIQWPEEYHFRGEEIELTTGIIKPFEIWYSTEVNKSRIDLFGGTISRYFYGPYNEGHYGKIYMIHPEVSQDDTQTEVKCEVIPTWRDQRDFLPDLYEFEFAGYEPYEDKTVQIWKKTEEFEGLMKYEEELIVEELKNDISVPLHHYRKTWDLEDGSLKEDTAVNYFFFNEEINKQDLDADAHHADCEEWRRFTDEFYEAIKYLHPSIESDVDVAFHRFKKHHNRAYEEEDDEHQKRKEIFKRNWRMIEKHNAKKLGYTLGLNQFADKTMKELAYLSGTGIPKDPIRGTHDFPHTESEVDDIMTDLPKDFDLRMEGVITPVRNQASCGSCWAFATAATVEGALARSNGGHLIDLSEQSLVDCAWAYKSHGCGGTEEINAPYEFLMKHGLPTVEEYGPYLGEDGYCRIVNMTEVYHIKGFVGVTKNSANSLKVAVYKYGPVTIGIWVSDRMAFYRSGVFYDDECYKDPEAMNHAVTLVGYGERDGQLYWIIKNSWGERWGESGYLLMSAKSNNCNVMTTPYYPIV